MFFNFSGSIKAIAIIVVAVSVIGFLWYFTSLRENLAIAKENNKKLQESVTTQQTVINQMKKDFEQIQRINRQLSKEVEERKKDVENLVEKFDKRDFGYIASQKPKLVENLINRASQNVARCFELASGAPLNDSEKNAKTPTEANNECPNLISGFGNTSVR